MVDGMTENKSNQSAEHTTRPQGYDLGGGTHPGGSSTPGA
jgi:hypothetical protein